MASVLAVPPAAALGTPVRDVLVVDVVDVVDEGPPSTSHVVYDSSGDRVPVAGPSAVKGGVRITRPVGATGVGVELLPADGRPLAVGTHTDVRGTWSAGAARPAPVLRLVTGASGCSSFPSTRAGTVTVSRVEHDADGVLTSLSATFRMPCFTASVTGEIRYRSTDEFAAAASRSSSLGSVAVRARTPFAATVTNAGSTPLELGAPTSVTVGGGPRRIEVVPGGDGCSTAPVPVGGQCRLSLEYVDDGSAGSGGGYVAELRMSAPSLARGHVSVLATVREVVSPPGRPQGIRTASAHDGIALDWNRDASSPFPQGWKVYRVDGPAPGLVTTLDLAASTWVDTSLAKGESATYRVAAYNIAGEIAADPVTVARQNRADPPAAVERRTLVVDGEAGVGVADTAAGATVRVTEHFWGETHVSGGGLTLSLSRVPGPGSFPVGPGPGHLSVVPSGPHANCGSTTGTAEVREAWVRADGTVHRLDADLHLDCVGTRLEVACGWGRRPPSPPSPPHQGRWSSPVRSGNPRRRAQ